MEIDHKFVFVEPDGADLEYLHSLGLVETYRRAHPGQGTQNACFCFDNMFLECLWVSDVGELSSDPIARTGLYERSQWRTAGTSPFGIAWRTTADDEGFDPKTWPFQPPYLPAGMAIDVSVDGDDPRQPMMFKSPGAIPPADWPPERRRTLQRSAGLGRILAIRLELPWNIPPSPTLEALARSTLFEVASAPGNIPSNVPSEVTSRMHSLTCEIESLDGNAPRIIRLPV